MNNKSIIKDLYKIMYLPRAERNNKLEKLLKNATIEDKAFISLLIIIRDNNKSRITKPKSYIDSYKHSLLMFLYHMTTTRDLNLSLSYLPKEEYQVAVSIIKGNELPLVEVLEHIDIIYTIKDIIEYVDMRRYEPISSDVVDSFEYTIKSVSRMWGNTNKGTNMPNNSIYLNSNMYTYTKEFKDYIQDKVTTFPKDILRLPEITPAEGKHLVEYTLSGYYLKYIDYRHEICKPKDWLVDDSYEAVGVTYEFRGREHHTYLHVGKKTLSNFTIKVFHTKRGKVVRCEYVDN